MDSNSFEDDNELVLTAFQAAPLAYEDVNGNANPIKVLDFEKESIALRQTLEKKGIRLKIKTATSKTLGNFLSKGSKLLHFSGHGNPLYLFIENEYGGAQQLHVNEDLRGWIRAGGNNLKFVFVAACSSRAAGDVFVEAGVQHVVCSEQNEQLLSHVAATVFAEDFYGSLANGSTIQKAYELATWGVVNSAAVRRTGLDPREEAKKFVLLPEGGSHEISLFPNPKKVKREIPLKVPPSKPSLIPFPPKPFVGREMEMYLVLKAMIAAEERLVTVTGVRGIGKASFCRAVGHYLEKRKIWGDVYWIPSARKGDNYDIGCLLSKVMTIIQKHNSAHTLLEDEEYQKILVPIFELLYVKQAVVIIDATIFNDDTSMGLLSLFLNDLFDKTKQVKLLVYHYKEVRLVPPKPTGFPNTRDTHIPLTDLDFSSTFVLFGRNCRHASPTSWSSDELYNRCRQYPDTVSKVLGGGVPTKTVILAKNMNEAEYKKLVDPSVPINESDFSQVLSHLSNCSETMNPSFMRPKPRNSNIPPPVKSQKEVQARFGPLLRQDGKIFRKKKSAYIRPAVKWEKITTVIRGKQETQKTVDDDSSKVVCGAAGEYYVLTDEEFRDSYDEKSLKQIPASTKDEHLRELRQDGFCEYQSKRFVWGRVVTEEDMRFFRHGADTPDVAYFEAPWNESERVEEGDYIVTQYPTHGKRNDGVYRIELGVFKRTYIDTDEEAEPPTNNCTNIGYWSSFAAVGIGGLSITAALNQQMSMLVLMNICLVLLLLVLQACWLNKQK